MIRRRVCPFLLGLAAGSIASAQSATAPGTTPEIFVSFAGVGDRTIEVGEPLFVTVRIEAPFESPARIDLAPTAGTWADAVTVTLAGGGTSRRATATFKPTTATTVLGADEAALGEWKFSSETTQGLAPGEYRIQARLAIRAGTGWKGETTGANEILRVLAPSTEPARVAQRAASLAIEALAANSPQNAARLLDAVLAAQPDHIRLLTLRAVVCVRGGDLRSAQTCVDRAFSVVRSQTSDLPPQNLQQVREYVTRELLAATPGQPAPPEWTQPPAAVRTPRRAPPAPTSSPVPPPRLTSDEPTTPPPPAPRTTTSPAPAIATATPVGPPPGQLVPVTDLSEAQILTDPRGQWAATATAGSSYSSPNYSAQRAAGAPNVPGAGDSVEAWCPGRQNDDTEWLELTYAKPVRAVEVRVRQTNVPGTIAKVEAVAIDGTTQVWWSGTDTEGLGANGLAWFAVRVPAADRPIAKIKLTLDLARRSGWKQIDAVQLVAAP